MNGKSATVGAMGGASICSACGYPYAGPGLCSWCRSVQVLYCDDAVRVDGFSGGCPRHAAANLPAPTEESAAFSVPGSLRVSDAPMSA